MYICLDCKLSFYGQAFSNGKCEICGCNINCHHVPCYKLCDKCAIEHGKCPQCGEEVER